MSGDTPCDVDQVRCVAQRWMDAVANADISGLAGLMTEDIVVIHGNGRKVEGRDAVLADFAHSFGSLNVNQSIEFEETVVAADWAFDRATVHTTICPREGGVPKRFLSRTITVLRRDRSQTWRVARAIGVVVQKQSGRSPDF